MRTYNSASMGKTDPTADLQAAAQIASKLVLGRAHIVGRWDEQDTNSPSPNGGRTPSSTFPSVPFGAGTILASYLGGRWGRVNFLAVSSSTFAQAVSMWTPWIWTVCFWFHPSGRTFPVSDCKSPAEGFRKLHSRDEQMGEVPRKGQKWGRRGQGVASVNVLPRPGGRRDSNQRLYGMDLAVKGLFPEDEKKLE